MRNPLMCRPRNKFRMKKKIYEIWRLGLYESVVKGD